MSDVRFVGHRGARFEAPENTLPGFRYGVELGLESVEFDVRMSADEQLVIIHDDSVNRTTNGEGKVSDLTLEEIQALDARSIFLYWPERCFVPTLAQVLDAVDQIPDLIIEIKSDTEERLDQIVSMTIAEVMVRGISSRVTLTSFNPYVVERVQQEAPQIRHGYIGNWDTSHFLERSIELGCAQADVHHPTADHELVARAKALGMRVICWPTNSREELEHVLTFEPDLICTDNPTLLRALYAEVLQA